MAFAAVLPLTGTTGSAGGDVPQKSVRFQHRGKRAANSQPNGDGGLPVKMGIRLFTGRGASDAREINFRAS